MILPREAAAPFITAPENKITPHKDPGTEVCRTDSGNFLTATKEVSVYAQSSEKVHAVQDEAIKD